MSNLSTTVPVGETASGVSLDQVARLQLEYEILEERVKELVAKEEDASNSTVIFSLR